MTDVPRVSEPSWHRTSWAVGVFFLLFPPLGLYLFFRSDDVSVKTRKIVVYILLFLGLFAGIGEYYFEAVSRAFILQYQGLCLGVGKGLVSSHRPENALWWYETGIAVNPLKTMLHIGYGEAQEELQQPQNALYAYIAARQTAEIEELPSGRISSYDRLYASLKVIELLLNDGRGELAQKYMDILLDEGLLTSAMDLPYAVLKGRLAILRKDYLFAEGEFRRVINSFSGHFGKTYEGMGDLYLAKKDYLKSLYYYCEALRYREGDTRLEKLIQEAGSKCRNLGISGAEQIPINSYIRMMRLRNDEKAGKQVAGVMSSLRKNFPDFVYNDGCLYVEAYVQYFSLENTHKAASLFSELADTFPESESFGKALWQAHRAYGDIGLLEHQKECLKTIIGNVDERAQLRFDAKRKLQRLSDETKGEDS